MIIVHAALYNHFTNNNPCPIWKRKLYYFFNDIWKRM